MSRTLVLGFGIAVCLLSSISAQEVSPGDLDALKAAFDKERAAAVAQKFPEASLERADELLKRADEAKKNGLSRQSAKLYREARWAVPYTPSDLPPHVERIMGIARMRHGEMITGVSFSNEPNLVATSSNDGTVKIWDLGNGREMRTFRSGSGPVRGVAWSKDGKLIASTAANDIILWEPATGKIVKTLKGHTDKVGSIAFSPDAKQLVSGGDDKSLRVWDVEKGEQKIDLINGFAAMAKHPINAVTFSPNGKLVASLNVKGMLQIFNPNAEKDKDFISGLEGHKNQPGTRIAFGKDNSVIFTAATGTGAAVKQWIGLGNDGETLPGHGRPSALDNTSDSVDAMGISPDGKFLAIGGEGKAVQLFDLSSGTPRLARTFQGHTDHVTALGFSPDGKTLVSGGKDFSMKLWSVSVTDEHTPMLGHTDIVWASAFNAAGDRIASGSGDKTILIRDLAGKTIQKLEGHTLPVTQIGYSPSGNQLVSVGGDKKAILWDAKDGKKVKEYLGTNAPLHAVTFLGESKFVTGGVDGIVRVWDVAQDKPTASFPDLKSPILSIVATSDESLLAVGTADGRVRLISVKPELKEISVTVAHVSGTFGLSFSNDGKRLATGGGDGNVKVWNVVATGPMTIFNEFKGHLRTVSAVAFSSDSRLLVSAGADLIVRIWDIQSKTEIKALRGHTEWVTAVSFAPKNQFVLSSSEDKSVRLWELPSNDTAKAFGHTRELRSISASGDGRWVASGSEDTTIKVWDAAAGSEAFTLDSTNGGHSKPVTALAFEPKSKRLVSACDEKIIIWDLEKRKPSTTFSPGTGMGVPYIQFSAKGDRFAVWTTSNSDAGDKRSLMTVYDLEGKMLSTLELKIAVLTSTFSVEADAAVVGFNDGSVQVWNLEKKERIGGDWAAFNKPLGDLGITPDKKKIVVADSECNVKIYDIDGKKVLKEFKCHEAAMSGLMISRDGQRFATIADNAEVKLWDIDGKELRSWKLPSAARSMAFSVDGKKLITANLDSTLTVLNLP